MLWNMGENKAEASLFPFSDISACLQAPDPWGRTLLLTYARALGTMYSGESWLSCQWLGRVGPWPVSPLGYPKLARQALTLNKGPRSGLELDNVTCSHGQEGRSWEARWKTPCPPSTHTPLSCRPAGKEITLSWWLPGTLSSQGLPLNPWDWIGVSQLAPGALIPDSQ